MKIETLWRDGDHGIFIRIQDDRGVSRDFYAHRGGMICPPLYTHAMLELATNAAKLPGIEEPCFSLPDN